MPTQEEGVTRLLSLRGHLELLQRLKGGRLEPRWPGLSGTELMEVGERGPGVPHEEEEENQGGNNGHT